MKTMYLMYHVGYLYLICHFIRSFSLMNLFQSNINYSIISFTKQFSFVKNSEIYVLDGFSTMMTQAVGMG